MSNCAAGIHFFGHIVSSIPFDVNAKIANDCPVIATILARKKIFSCLSEPPLNRKHLPISLPLLVCFGKENNNSSSSKKNNAKAKQSIAFLWKEAIRKWVCTARRGGFGDNCILVNRIAAHHNSHSGLNETISRIEKQISFNLSPQHTHTQSQYSGICWTDRIIRCPYDMNCTVVNHNLQVDDAILLKWSKRASARMGCKIENKQLQSETATTPTTKERATNKLKKLKNYWITLSSM